MAALAALSLAATLGASPAGAQAPGDEADVRRAVAQFLDDLGHRRVDALPAQLAPKASLAITRQRDGAWTVTTQTADEWLAGLKAQTSPTPFAEPLTNVSVHVESGQLAHVRADFTVVSAGEVRSHGVDYFTLVKDAGAWKLVHLAYTSIPGAP
jgi:ketosteroid isomerase-like protein